MGPAIAIMEVGYVIWKKDGAERVLLGPGLTTDTKAVPGLATSEERILALN
jgi:hypothetical protein